MDTPLARQEILVAALRSALGEAVEVVETHISWVLLAGDYAYKIKKAVNLGFLDFSTLEKRRFYCAEELRLNRRLAPDLYLEVVPIAGSADHPVLNGPGPAIEYAVKMRRFPQACLLDQVLLRGELTPETIDAIARRIADFHGRTAIADNESPFGTPERAHLPVAENFAQIRPRLRDNEDLIRLDELERWSEREYQARFNALAARKARGLIRECHGDLHLGNMALLDGEAVPFDCIEFSDNLRWIDVISEAAFLAMDLQDRGRPDLARRFLNAYLEQTGDYEGLEVLRYYLVYRAMVRAKVACIRAGQDGTVCRPLDAIPQPHRTGGRLHSPLATFPRHHPRPVRLRKNHGHAIVAGSDELVSGPFRRGKKTPVWAQAGGAQRRRDRRRHLLSWRPTNAPTGDWRKWRGESSSPASPPSSMPPSSSGGSAPPSVNWRRN